MTQKKLPLINSAHGSETRNIINELINLFNGMGYTYNESLQKAQNVLNEAERVNKENVSTQKQVDELILHAGQSDAEVIQARGGLPLLKDRLDESDSQLAQTADKANNAESLSVQANAKADNPLAAISAAGYKLSLDDLSNEVKDAMTGTTGITTAKGLLENNRGVEFPLQNVTRDGVLHPFDEEVKDVVLDAKVFNPDPEKYYSITEIRNGASDGWGINIYEYDKKTFATESEASRKQIVSAVTNGFRPQPESSIDTIDVTAEEVRFLITVDYSKIQLNALFLDVGSSPKAKGNVIHESNYVYNLTERLELPEKNRGIEYPLKNVKRDGEIHDFSVQVKNVVLDVKVIGAELGKVYSLSYISKGAFDSYGFTIYEYDEETFGTNSAESQKRILHISTELYGPPETDVVTRIAQADNGVIFNITVDYSLISGNNLNIANSLNGQAYGGIIDKSNYIYSFNKSNGGNEDNADNNKTLKLLMIGNSFSKDVTNHIHHIAASAGVNLIVGNLSRSGESLQNHWGRREENTYTYYKKTSLNGVASEETLSGFSLGAGVTDEDWDIITFQQNSGNSTNYSTFQPYLNDLINYVGGLATNTNVEFGMHLTWARASSNLSSSYESTAEMYQAISDAYQQALAETDIDIIIPTGTIIENARTNSYLLNKDNELTDDGIHLGNFGDFIGGLGLFEAVLSKKYNVDLIEHVSYLPSGESKFLTYLAKVAVKNAVMNPFTITKIQ